MNFKYLLISFDTLATTNLNASSKIISPPLFYHQTNCLWQGQESELHSCKYLFENKILQGLLSTSLDFYNSIVFLIGIKMDRNDWKLRYFSQNIRDLINEKSKNNSDKRTIIDHSSSIFYTAWFLKKKDSNSNFLSINNYEFYISIQSLISVPIIKFYTK